jgi:hypothetical protein
MRMSMRSMLFLSVAGASASLLTVRMRHTETVNAAWWERSPVCIAEALAEPLGCCITRNSGVTDCSGSTTKSACEEYATKTIAAAEWKWKSGECENPCKM